MSVSSSSHTASEPKNSHTDDPSSTYWVRDDCREFITDSNGEVVNLARLTAYAEHRDDIYVAHVHHKIPLLKVDAPAFLDALSPDEHARLHNSNPNPVEVDGFPLVRAE